MAVLRHFIGGAELCASKCFADVELRAEGGLALAESLRGNTMLRSLVLWGTVLLRSNGGSIVLSLGAWLREMREVGRYASENACSCEAWGRGRASVGRVAAQQHDAVRSVVVALVREDTGDLKILPDDAVDFKDLQMLIPIEAHNDGGLAVGWC